MNGADCSTLGSDLWYRVVIQDPQLAVSSSFRQLLEKTLLYVPSSVVTVAGLETVSVAGGGVLKPCPDAQTLSVDSLLEALGSVVQFVWGRFFLFRDDHDAQAADGQGLSQRIAMSQATICVVDNSSYFVFTRSCPLVCVLLADPWRVEVVKEELSMILARPEDL
jgi:hypothetical protein